MKVELGARYERKLKDGNGRIFFKVIGVAVRPSGRVHYVAVKEFSWLRNRFSIYAEYPWQLVDSCRKLKPEEKVI